MSKKTYKQFIEEQNEIYEILGFAARKKKARAMIIMMKKSAFKFKRKLKAMKTTMLRPDAERLGLKAVVNFVKQKIVGKGKDLKDMGVSAKMRVEKLAKKKMSQMGAKVKMMAKRFAKGIMIKHKERAIAMKKKGAEDAVNKVHKDAKAAGVDPKVAAKAKEKHMDKIDKTADTHAKGGESEADLETGTDKKPEQDLAKGDDDKKSDDKKTDDDDKKDDGKKKGFKGFMKKMFGKKDK